jgi:hypothetical protein
MVKIYVTAILGSSEADLKNLPHVVRPGADPGGQPGHHAHDEPKGGVPGGAGVGARPSAPRRQQGRQPVRDHDPGAGGPSLHFPSV